MTMYVIRNKNDNSAWDDEQGWISEGWTFNLYTEEEKEKMNLPIDGYWEQLPD